MKQVLTLVVKLQPTSEQCQLLGDTAHGFADACNYINKTVKPKLTNRISIQAERDKFNRVIASLQKKAFPLRTRSKRRRCRQILKRLSGRERRYQAWINHDISKAIIDEVKQTKFFVSIEDLTGIRERTNQQTRNKTEPRRSNSWAFYQLRTFLEYKGISEGIEVVAINPRYTSQTCHCCLHIGLRNNKSLH